MTAYKVLSLWQPWASLVALGVKTVETRSWSTGYRGPLAIHAGTRKPYTGNRFGWIGPYCLGQWSKTVDHAEPCDCDLDEEQLGDRCAVASKAAPALLHDEGAHGYSFATFLPLGVIVATCRLVDCVRTERVEWAPERFEIKGRLVEWARWGMSDAVDARIAEEQRPYGDFAPGRYAWLLADVEPLDEPVPFRGGQGLTKTWAHLKVKGGQGLSRTWEA